MKIIHYLIALLATVFGGRTQATTTTAPAAKTTRSPMPITQSPASAPKAPEKVLVINYVDPEDEPDAIVPVILADEQPLPIRLHEAQVVKWRNLEPAKAKFRAKSGQTMTATVVEIVGTLVRLRRGNGGTFVRSLA